MRSSSIRENSKPVDPREKASLISHLFFWYTLKTFKKGWNGGFTEADLYGVSWKYQSENLGNKLEQEWNKEKSKAKPSLFRAIRAMFLKNFIGHCIVLVIMQTLKLSQPISLYYLMMYFEPNQKQYTKAHAILCTFFVVLPSFITVFGVHSYMMTLQHMGMKARIACCSLVYRKCLKLSRRSLENTNLGQMINLLSSDVNRFDFVCLQLPYLFDVPIEVIIITFLIYFFAGNSPFVGAAAILLQIPMQIILGKKFSQIRLRKALLSDERVRITNEIISGIQVIKMYTWEESFAKLVADARRIEIKEMQATGIIRSVLLSLATVTSRLAVFLTVMVHVMEGNIPIPRFVFLIVTIFGVMRHSVTVALPNAIAQIAEARVSIKRLQEFLLLEEQSSQSNQTDFIGIKLQNVNAKWSSTKSEYTLSNLNLELAEDDFVAVIGMVGSGKSSFLNLLLQELPVSSGSLLVSGVISYAAQEPWLFYGTIKQNIIFGQEYDYDRYNEVLRICSLKRDLTLFPRGEETVIGESGVALSGGQKARINLARAIYKIADIYLLDDPLSAVDSKVGNVIFDECIKTFLSNKCTILVTHQVQYLKKVPKIMILQEGQITFVGKFEDMAGAKPDLVERMTKDSFEEDFSTSKLPVESDSFPRESSVVMDDVKEQPSIGKVQKCVYKAYINAGGNFCVLLALGFLFVGTQIIFSSCDLYIAYWINTEEIRGVEFKDELGYKLLKTETYVLIYSAMIGTMILVTIIRSISFFTFCMNASYVLHENMFDSVVRAPMCFFNKNLTGKILNRFSKDMATIDEQFPFVALETLQIGLSVFGVIVVTLFINPFMIFPISVILIVFYILRIYYLRTSRNLKRLEGITRSPVFAHLNSSLQGLSTIRAFKVQEMLCREFDHHQDHHTSSWDVFLFTSRAFGFCLDFICCIYITIVAFSFLLIFNEKFGANVGLAITQSLSLTGMFQWGMRQWSELENYMTCVERVYEFTSIKPETNVKETQKPPPYWPQAGAIEFRNVFLQYGLREPYVLKNLNFKIKPKQKIGIVGRTGAGKSSIITSLFQLAETEGQIIIDDLDIQTISLKKLRSKIAIIPQEPVLFAGTLRTNLDPFQEHSDTLLWKAIEEVELLQVVCKLPAGLSSKISEGGTNFSVGQRQLLCLARAIVRSNRILVLDEATANVDPETDSLIQATIRHKFQFCTVLTIAHRLHTILDADRVLVMDNGAVAEFGYSYVLLQKRRGIFRSLVLSSGKVLAREMMNTAKENYIRRLESGSNYPLKPLDPEDTKTEVTLEVDDLDLDDDSKDRKVKEE